MQLLKCKFDHKDCFGRNDKGKCICLSKMDFKEDDCPFYRNKDEVDEERKKVQEDLIRKGRYDLLEKYKSDYLDDEDKE